MKKLDFDTFWQAHGIAPTSKLILGISGGPDSMALLHALMAQQAATPFTLHCAHVNHGLHPIEADTAQALVQATCQRYLLPCHIAHYDVAAIANADKRGLEETGRRLRYEFFTQLLTQEQADYYVTAHTADDNTETLLLHLLRGCGTGGLRGMNAVNGKHLRPLLTVTRDQIIAYITHYKVPHVVDSSNASPRFTRNRIRHELLPLLRDFNPLVSDALTRLSESATQDDDCLKALAAQLVRTDANGQRYCLKSELRTAHPALQARALRLLYPSPVGLEHKHVAAMLQAIERNSGTELPHGLRMACRKGKITVYQNPTTISY